MKAPMIISLIGLVPEIRVLVKELIEAIREGRPDKAAMAAQRAAEITAFKMRHGWTP